MKLSAAFALLLLAAGAAAPAPVQAGGSLLTPPAKLSESDCAAGSPARYSGSIQPTTLGCLQLPEGPTVVVAAEDSSPFVCFYLAPAGARNEGPCLRFGAPTFEGRGLDPMAMGRYGKDLIAWGVSDLDSDASAFEAPTKRSPAISLTVDSNLAETVGAPRGFRVFAGKVQGFEPCGPVKVLGRGSKGAALRASFQRSQRTYPGPPLALEGSRVCKTQIPGAIDSLLLALTQTMTI